MNDQENLPVYKEIDIPLGNVKSVDRGSGFDPNKYQGFKIKIGEVKIVQETNFYPDGQTYNADSKELMYRVYIYTEALPELDTTGNPTGRLLEVGKAPNKKNVRVHARFNLLTGENGEPEISKNPKAKLWAFMRKKGADSLEALKSMYVVLDTEIVQDAETKEDRTYLRISGA